VGVSGSKVKGGGQECPSHTGAGAAYSRFLTGLSARFGMTSLISWGQSEAYGKP
jgi:hypothetical protein